MSERPSLRKSLASRGFGCCRLEVVSTPEKKEQGQMLGGENGLERVRCAYRHFYFSSSRFLCFPAPLLSCTTSPLDPGVLRKELPEFRGHASAFRESHQGHHCLTFSANSELKVTTAEFGSAISYVCPGVCHWLTLNFGLLGNEVIFTAHSVI